MLCVRLPFVLSVLSALLFEAQVISAEEPTLESHISTVVSLAPEYRDKVKEFLSDAPIRATGRSVDALLAKNAINLIDPREEYVARFSSLEVFGHIALNTARRPEDRAYAISKLGRLASVDAEVAKQAIAIIRKISREDDGRAKRAADVALKKLENLAEIASPRDIVAELNEALGAGDSERALSLFHRIGDCSALEQAVPRFKSIGSVVDSERILDLAIVVVRKRRDIDPICLVKTREGWKVCRDVTEFTLPVSTYSNAKSMVTAMDALQSWYEKRKQQLLSTDNVSP